MVVVMGGRWPEAKEIKGCRGCWELGREQSLTDGCLDFRLLASKTEKEYISIVLNHQRRHLSVPWTARRSNQSILKETNPEYSLEGLMLKC